MNALELRGLSVQYGGVRALDNVDLDVPAGTLVGLIGPNGAGKTTLIDAATGFAPARGRVLLEGQDITSLPAHRRARLGMSRTWQGVELFSELSVRDNVRVATERPSLLGILADAVRPWRGQASPSVDAALDLVGISHLADVKPGELPAGHQKLVGIARGLASDGRVVFLDEPAAGLDHSESDVLSSHLRRVVDAGITVLLVEHDMRLVFAVSDRVAVLDQGRLIAEGSPDEVRQDPAVIAAYLGTTVAVETPEEALR
jgi:ABC-type branched-subunit amino acid transport system ATPase component